MLNRRTFMQGAIASAVAAGCASGASPEQSSKPTERDHSTLDIGADRQLFIDDHLIASKEDVVLAVNPPLRGEMVLFPEKEWEAGGITCYATALWDPIQQEFRLYYVPVSFATPGLTFRLALATSKDGIHWERPDLGVVEFNGSKQNNIVIDNEREGTVFIDPNAPPERRYAYLSGNDKTGILYYSSPDGIHFTRGPALTSYWSDSQTSTFWDPSRRKYVSYPRAMYQGGGKWRMAPQLTFSDNIKLPPENDWGRCVARIETDRADEPWPNAMQVVMAPDALDPPGVDLYTNAACKYALAPNSYLAFPTPYYHYATSGRTYLNQPTLAAGGKANDGVIETQLATSRDGITWTRHHTSYVPLQHVDDLDLKLCQVFPGLLYHPDRIDQYFAGYNHTHGDTQARKRLHGRQIGGIFRLTQRIDGFTSMDFAYTGGAITTRPIVFKGRRLMLNVNTSAAGEARVGLLDPAGKPIEGFAINDCRIVNGDHLASSVEWSGGNDLSRLAAQPIRLRFEMRGTKLFSFWFAEMEL